MAFDFHRDELMLAIAATDLPSVDRGKLEAACLARLRDPSRPLASLLVEQQVLDAEECARLMRQVAAMAGQPGQTEAFARGGNAAEATLAYAAHGAVEGPSPPTRIKHAASGQRFRVLRLHARGGLGEVSIAHDEELNREVALKEIQLRHANDADSRQRFLSEAEITARLEHPGIVPVYARGDDQGRLYYAMRLIRGESLSDAIAHFHSNEQRARQDLGQRQLALRKLLARFIDVCNAVAYAHSRGVVHRDIKPANIMMGPYGETLLVDWGLAKITGCTDESTHESALDSAFDASSSATQFGTVMGTPAYMSPEQALGQIERIGPASDIYSLGATLYELLTGRSPFDDERVQESNDLFVRIAAGRFRPPRSVRKDVPAGLEAICLKAMALERQNRYGSARGLADDIDAWLADEPVRAWREPWRMRAARWSRRHRALVTSVTAAAAVALISLTTGVWLLARANDRISVERDRAERSSQYLTEASNGLMDVVEQWLTRQPEAASLQQRLLGKPLELYQRFLEQEPANIAARQELVASQQRVAGIRRTLGQYDLAAQHSRSAMALSQQLAKELPADPQIRRQWAAAANWLGESLRLGSRLDEAERAYNQARFMQVELGKQHPNHLEYAMDLARTLYNLGLLWSTAGRHGDAESVYVEAIELLERVPRSSEHEAEVNQHLARCHINLGIVLKNTARLPDADEHYRSAIELLTALAEASDDPEYRYELAAATLNRGNLLLVSRSDARLANGQALNEARRAYQSAIDILVPLCGEFAGVPRYRKELANAHNGLGGVHQLAGQSEEAAVAWQEARREFSALVAATPQSAEFHSALGMTLGNLALVARGKDDGEAVLLLRSAIEQQQEAVAIEPANQANRKFLSGHRYLLARVELDRGDHAAAIKQAESLVNSSDEGQDAWRAGSLMARAAVAARDDERLAADARRRTSERYAERAFDCLRRAIERKGVTLKQLDEEEAWKPFHDRLEYQALRRQLEAAKSR